MVFVLKNVYEEFVCWQLFSRIWFWKTKLFKRRFRKTKTLSTFPQSNLHTKNPQPNSSNQFFKTKFSKHKSSVIVGHKSPNTKSSKTNSKQQTCNTKKSPKQFIQRKVFKQNTFSTTILETTFPNNSFQQHSPTTFLFKTQIFNKSCKQQKSSKTNSSNKYYSTQQFPKQIFITNNFLQHQKTV